MNSSSDQSLIAARRLNALLFASTSIVWWANAAGEFVEEQPHWQAYTGQSWDEYRGDKWITAVHPEDRSAIKADWDSAVASGSPYFTQGRIWSAKHNAYRAFQSRGIAIRNQAGEVEEWLGAVTDVQDTIDIKTLLARTQEDLARSLNSLRVSEARLREQDQQLEREAAALRRLNKLASRLWQTRELPTGLDEILRATIELLSADKGNIQLFDPARGVLTIAAQQGFNQNFLDFFAEVAVGHGSACARALQSGERVIIEDVEADEEFAPLRTVAAEAGYRAVQSTPLFGHDGSVLGMLSTHFSYPQRPAASGLALLDMYCRLTANFIMRVRLETEQKQREEHVRLLLREVNHRSKNMLAVVQSIARHSLRNNPETFIGDFEKRLQALAKSQDLVVNNDWKGVLLEDVVRTQLAHLANRANKRIVIDGERVIITPAAAQTLSMAVHELVTNATKYGALSAPAGSVQVSWGFLHNDGARQFRFAWIEQGGPAAEPPKRRGFGTTVLETITARALGASSVLDYRPSGLAWHLMCPADRITSEDA